MTFSNFDAVFFSATFLVPGFICSAVVSMMVPRRASAANARVLEFLTFSCINYGVCSWAIYLLFYSHSPLPKGITVAGIVAITLVSPIVLGLVLGYLAQRNWPAKFLARFGFRTIHPIPSAWDLQFGRNQPYWLIVTLRNGSRILGLYGLQSFAGDEPGNRDLYLESTYRMVEETGEWAPVKDSGGVLIMADQIAVIEFFRMHEVNYE